MTGPSPRLSLSLTRCLPPQTKSPPPGHSGSRPQRSAPSHEVAAAGSPVTLEEVGGLRPPGQGPRLRAGAAVTEEGWGQWPEAAAPSVTRDPPGRPRGRAAVCIFHSGSPRISGSFSPRQGLVKASLGGPGEAPAAVRGSKASLRSALPQVVGTKLGPKPGTSGTEPHLGGASPVPHA